MEIFMLTASAGVDTASGSTTRKRARRTPVRMVLDIVTSITGGNIA